VADDSTEFRETVRRATDLVSLIGESVALKPTNGGREFVGLCPFHDDHNPSMRVYPDRQTFRCWVCNTGGDCFAFVMEEAKIGFRDALELLAGRANIAIPKRLRDRSSSESADADEKPKIMEALLWAQNLFHKALFESNPASEAALKYLEVDRGLSRETLRRFWIGYHPNDWNWLLGQSRGKFSPQILEAAKLVGKRDNGQGHYDNFVDRVLFPIWNERGQPVAFGGRVLPGGDDSHGKYWNSPESAVFHKSRLVYALSLARDGIKKSDSVIVTEGYTDCIALQQAGIDNAVATLGTALTEQHVTTLKRFVRKVVLVYDGDDAGQDAAERAVERFLAQDVDLRILSLPGKLDPAEFIAAEGADAFRALADEALEAWEYKYRKVARRFGTASVDARQRVLEEMLSLLAVVPKMSGHVREAMLLGHLSQRLGVSEQQVRDRYREVRTNAGKSSSARPHAEPRQPHIEITRLYSSRATAEDRPEVELVEAVCAQPSLLSFLHSGFSLEAVQNRALKRILTHGLSFASGRESITFQQWLDAIEHPDLKRLFIRLDEEARRKAVPRLLQDLAAADGCPLYLRRLMDQLSLRQEEQSQQQVAADWAATGEGTRGLDAAALEALRQASEFHQRRATRKTSV
jgi:DNA primase